MCFFFKSVRSVLTPPPPRCQVILGWVDCFFLPMEVVVCDIELGNVAMCVAPAAPQTSVSGQSSNAGYWCPSTGTAAPDLKTYGATSIPEATRSKKSRGTHGGKTVGTDSLGSRQRALHVQVSSPAVILLAMMPWLAAFYLLCFDHKSSQPNPNARSGSPDVLSSDVSPTPRLPFDLLHSNATQQSSDLTDLTDIGSLLAPPMFTGDSGLGVMEHERW